jgi:hypothetical protein
MNPIAPEVGDGLGEKSAGVEVDLLFTEKK